MNADVNRGKSGKIATVLLLSLLVLAGLAFAGYKYFGQSTSRVTAASPEESRELVDKYLKKKSRRSDFKTSLDALKKEKRPWEVLAKQYDSVPDYETVYRLIGEHLWIAENYLKSSEKRDQRIGLQLLREEVEVASDIAVDDWLACRICEAYLVPIFKKDDQLSDENEHLVYIVGRKYAEADETENEIDLEKYYLSKKDSGRFVDWARYRLVRLLENAGRHDEAEEIKKTLSGKRDRTARGNKTQDKATNSAAKN